jgi:hypothetical protein
MQDEGITREEGITALKARHKILSFLNLLDSLYP